ncbi:S26 family signal peptidase [Streptococcus ruminantium]|uniref:S26 family signal peptidase n=1 Tax=Streptococcus ruminantium TaxID=1917441 RepID=UPI0012DE0FEF|nr:S26 family signal peptidase [Streptococcus ruminantium]
MNHSQIREELEAGRSVIYVTQGISMRPLLYDKRHKKATQIRLEPLPDHSLKIGDIPIFQKKSNGQLVLHRIIHQDEQYYYTRGDNCLHGETVAREQVFGYVTKIYRKGKWFSTDHKGYKIYVSIWLHSLWLRKPFMLLRQQLSRLKRKIQGQ